MADLICSSCKRKATNMSVTKFLCPNCGKQEIARCMDCRKNAIKYTCPQCNFVGPN
ncbi:MAG: zinc finger domain-containing protein [Candidatus Woesearchaeota archaeon]